MIVFQLVLISYWCLVHKVNSRFKKKSTHSRVKTKVKVNQIQGSMVNAKPSKGKLNLFIDSYSYLTFAFIFTSLHKYLFAFINIE